MGVLKKVNPTAEQETPGFDQVSPTAEQETPGLNHLMFPVYPKASRWQELSALDTRTPGLTGSSAEQSVLDPGRRAPIGRNPI